MTPEQVREGRRLKVAADTAWKEYAETPMASAPEAFKKAGEAEIARLVREVSK